MDPLTDAQLAARRQTARTVNHRRWHDGPIDSCSRCAEKLAATGGGLG